MMENLTWCYLLRMYAYTLPKRSLYGRDFIGFLPDHQTVWAT